MHSPPIGFDISLKSSLIGEQLKEVLKSYPKPSVKITNSNIKSLADVLKDFEGEFMKDSNNIELFPFSMFGLKVRQQDPLDEPKRISYNRRHRTLTAIFMQASETSNDRAVRLMSSLNTELTMKSDIVVFLYDSDNVVYGYVPVSNVAEIDLTNLDFMDLPPNPTFEEMFTESESHYSHVMFHMNKNLLLNKLTTEKSEV